MDYTEALANLTRQAGWLDEGSNEQAVFLFERLRPIVGALAAQVAGMGAGDVERHLTCLEDF